MESEGERAMLPELVSIPSHSVNMSTVRCEQDNGVEEGIELVNMYTLLPFVITTLSAFDLKQYTLSAFDLIHLNHILIF